MKFWKSACCCTRWSRDPRWPVRRFPLQAKAVFTPSRAIVTNGDTLQIDLNNDGVTDFKVWVIGSSRTSAGNRLPHFYGFDAKAAGYASSDVTEGSRKGLVALRHGEKIGSGGYFGRGGLMAWYDLISSGVPFSSGPFAHLRWHFLGVRFPINGQNHYGWIGFRSVRGNQIKLFGWAYETEPNTPILAGQGILERDASGFAEPTSLALLAYGHVAMADWRRRKAAA